MTVPGKSLDVYKELSPKFPNIQPFSVLDIRNY